MNSLTAFSIALGVSLIAAAAHAEPARPVIDPAQRAALTLQRTRAEALAAAVFPRTAVDTRIASDKVVGSLGFLCGREPGYGDSGSAAAYGVDPHGRFVGARLSLAF